MNWASLICLVVIALISAVAAKHLYDSRIINGQNAKNGQFPHMVSLQSSLTYSHHCGGSILSSRFILTAAHCCQGGYANPKNVVAVVGTIHLSRGGVTVKLDKIAANKKFHATSVKYGIYDVAVIRTATDIIFTDLIQPIALPKVNLPEDRAVKVVLSGWGYQEVFKILFCI